MRERCTNWGCGRLIPYDSFASTVARFSVLNGITVSEARKFLKSKGIRADYFYAVTHIYYHANGNELRRLAKILDEPIAKVRTIDGLRLGLPKWYRDRENRLAVQYLWTNSVRYCPICLREGYHAVFHEYRWLERCPIHNAEIHNRPVNTSGDCLFVRYAKTIRTLFELESPQWLSIQKRQTFWSSINKGDSGERISLFFKWVHAVQNLCYSQKLIVPFRNSFDFSSNLDIWLGRLAWLYKIPPKILPLFAVSPRLVTPWIEKLPNALVEHLIDLNSRTNKSLSILVGFIKQTALLSFEESSYVEAARSYLLQLNSEHGSCSCKWSSTIGHYGWDQVHPGNKPYGFCPYSYAISEVTRIWTEFEFALKSPYRRHNHGGWHEYVSVAKILLERDLADPIPNVDYSLSSQYTPQVPYIKLRLQPELRSFFDTLLLADFEAHKAELNFWLKSIESGSHPMERLNSPSTTFLIVKGDALELQRWPTILRRRSNDSNGRWSPEYY